MQHSTGSPFFNLFCERKGDVKVSVSTKYKFSLTEKTIKLPVVQRDSTLLKLLSLL